MRYIKKQAVIDALTRHMNEIVVLTDLKDDVYAELLSISNCPSNVSDDPNTIRSLHAECGMATEIGELLDIAKRAFFYCNRIEFTTEEIAHIKEELGDWLWYTQLYQKTTFVEHMNDLNDVYSCGDKIINAVELMCTLLMGPISDLPNELHQLVHLILNIGFDLDEIVDLNIKKLMIRYNGDSPTEETALNRNLDVEQKVFLENNNVSEEETD